MLDYIRLVASFEYNGQTTNLYEGQVAILKCVGRRMRDDIKINFFYPGAIVYDGAETHIEGQKTATIPCKDQRAKTDIVIASSKGVKLVSSNGYFLLDKNGVYITTMEE